MDNYICKRGNKEDLLKRWNYLVDIHPGNNSWIVFRENNIRNFDNNYIIRYYGILNDKVICEITAYIRPEAFILIILKDFIVIQWHILQLLEPIKNLRERDILVHYINMLNRI